MMMRTLHLHHFHQVVRTMMVMMKEEALMVKMTMDLNHQMAMAHTIQARNFLNQGVWVIAFQMVVLHLSSGIITQSISS